MWSWNASRLLKHVCLSVFLLFDLGIHQMDVHIAEGWALLTNIGLI